MRLRLQGLRPAGLALPGRAASVTLAKRLAVLGAAIGALLALLALPPAAWLAKAVSAATEQRLLLAEARGTWWSGSAVLVLTGGPGSRDAAALPGRLHWQLGLSGRALSLTLQQACCIETPLALRLVPGLGRWRVELPSTEGPARALGQWPMEWLVGLGTPWNTLAPRGAMALASQGFSAEAAQGRWRFSGQLDLSLRGAASRLSTLPQLGDYRLTVQAREDGAAALQLSTEQGALQLSGQGEWAPSLRFRGQASAGPGAEAALANLLNIIGRRQGAVSLISIG